MYTLVLGGGEEWEDSIHFTDAMAAKRALIVHSIGYHHDRDQPDVQPFLVEHREKFHAGRLAEHDVLHVPLQQCKRAMKRAEDADGWVRLKRKKANAEAEIPEQAYKDFE
jgi:hypothetical protein